MLHPFEKARDFQILKWGSFALKQEYEFELISAKQAPTMPYGQGGYTQFCAISLNDYSNPMILKGDFFQFDISYNEFVRALSEVHPVIRKALNEGEDVIIKFMKTSIKAMRIIEMKASQSVPELKEKAEAEYNKLKGKDE